MLEGHVHGPQGQPGLILIRYPDSMSAQQLQSPKMAKQGAWFPKMMTVIVRIVVTVRVSSNHNSTVIVLAPILKLKKPGTLASMIGFRRSRC